MKKPATGAGSFVSSFRSGQREQDLDRVIDGRAVDVADGIGFGRDPGYYCGVIGDARQRLALSGEDQARPIGLELRLVLAGHAKSEEHTSELQSLILNTIA